MADDDKPKKNEWVPWLALGVSMVALCVSGFSAWVTYQQSPLSGRYAPKLTAQAVTLIYRLQGKNEMYSMGTLLIENSGKGPASDIYFGVDGIPKDASVRAEGAECKLVTNEKGSRLHHVPLLPKGTALTFLAEPRVMPDNKSYPVFTFVNAPDGRVEFDTELEQKNVEHARASLQTIGLPDFHGDNFVEPVQFVFGQRQSIPENVPPDMIITTP